MKQIIFSIETVHAFQKTAYPFWDELFSFVPLRGENRRFEPGKRADRSLRAIKGGEQVAAVEKIEPVNSAMIFSDTATGQRQINCTLKTKIFFSFSISLRGLGRGEKIIILL